jgi:LuxR family transcriptional regulator, quorum-sensing system regulator CciR
MPMGRRKRGSLGGYESLHEFVQATRTLESMASLHSFMDALIRDLGFANFALAHHVALIAPPKSVVRIHNYPDSWVEAVIENRYFSIDPVHIVARKSAAGFHWREFGHFITLSEKQLQMQEAAKRAGIANGFTVPVNIPGEHPGTISFTTRIGVGFPDLALPTANFLGPLAFEAARRLANRASAEASSGDGAILTNRQLECIAFVARGKSDTDIARIMGLSPATVKFHIDNARERLNVATRTQLVVRALYGNQLTFADLMTGLTELPPPSPTR